MPQNAKGNPDITAGLHAHHYRTLVRIFQHPLSHNLNFRDVSNLIEAIGAVEVKHNGDVTFQIRGDKISIDRPQDKDLSTDETMILRHFLQRTGWRPDTLAYSESIKAGSDIIIVIDHAEANIYTVDAQSDENGKAKSVTPTIAKHVLHDVDPEQHDSDRDQTNPADLLFFGAVADFSQGTGRIVIIGHGKGQSNESNHLMKYLTSHHSDIKARVVSDLVADLPHMTVPQLLELGHNAMLNGAQTPA